MRRVRGGSLKKEESLMTILLAAALLPPIILMIWVYRLDKIEKEPPRLIIKLLIFGALTCIPAAIIESVAGELLTRVFPFGYGTAYTFLYYFLVVAWTEEGVKHFALKHGSWKNPAFNYRFDAIVYAAAAALGFAAFENVMYVFQYGFEVALLRAATAIPGHCIFGIYMGYYYGQAKYCEQHGDLAGRRQYQFLSIFMPIMLHGFYDFCATLEYDLMTIVFLVYIVILDIFAFKSIRRFAREDEHIPGTAEEGDAGYGADPYRDYRQGTYGGYGDTTYTNWQNQQNDNDWQNQQNGQWQQGSGQNSDDDPLGIGPLSH